MKTVYTTGMVLVKGNKLELYDGSVVMVKMDTPRISTYKTVDVCMVNYENIVTVISTEKIHYILELSEKDKSEHARQLLEQVHTVIPDAYKERINVLIMQLITEYDK